jgi:hypothetical protein
VRTHRYAYCSIEYALANEQVSDPHSAKEKENHIVEMLADVLSVTAQTAIYFLYPS